MTFSSCMSVGGCQSGGIEESRASNDPTSTALWRLAAQLFDGKIGNGQSNKERTDATKALDAVLGPCQRDTAGMVTPNNDTKRPDGADALPLGRFTRRQVVGQ